MKFCIFSFFDSNIIYYMITVCKVNFVRQKHLANNNDCMSLHTSERTPNQA